MAKLKISNNAVSRLSANISPADTSISLLPGGGASFPSLATDEWFPATIVKADGSLEIVRVTARATDVLTVVRAQEATAAIAFSAGDRVEHRFTAAAYTEENARVEAIAQDALDTVSTAVDDLIDNLAAPGGAEMIGNGGSTVAASLTDLAASIAAQYVSTYDNLRAYTGDKTSVYVTGYLGTSKPSGKAGMFVRGPAGVDNNATVIVSSNGMITWYRIFKDGVDPQWWGAIIDEVSPGFDSSTAIQAAKAYAETSKLMMRLPNGTLNCSSDIVLNQSTTIHGNGQEVSIIKMTGNAKFVSSRPATVDFVDLRDFRIKQGGTNDRGLDIGTLRRGIIQNIYVEGFKIGVALDMGVSLVANYWNRLINVTASCTGQTSAGSIGFLFGNTINATYPDTDYNVLMGCKSFGCETAIFMINSIGCQVIGHQATVVGTALNILSGNNNYVQIMAENCLRMGGAESAANGNKFELYNDGDLATPFLDKGWNKHSGQIIGQKTIANDFREGDCKITDRIYAAFTAATQQLFVVKTPAKHAAFTVTTTCSGYIAGTVSFVAVQIWDVTRRDGLTPVVTAVRTSGTAVLTVNAAPDGDVTWSLTGNASVLTISNTTVSIQGYSVVETFPYGKPIGYQKLFIAPA